MLRGARPGYSRVPPTRPPEVFPPDTTAMPAGSRRGPAARAAAAVGGSGSSRRGPRCAPPPWTFIVWALTQATGTLQALLVTPVRLVALGIAYRVVRRSPHHAALREQHREKVLAETAAVRRAGPVTQEVAVPLDIRVGRGRAVIPVE